MMTREDLTFRQLVARSAYSRGIITHRKYQQILTEADAEKEIQDTAAQKSVLAVKIGMARILDRCDKTNDR